MLRNPTRGGLIIARTCIRLSLYLAVVLAASGLGRAAGEKVRPAPLVRVAPGSIEPGTPAAARSGGRSGASARAMAPIPIEKISFDAVGLAPGSHANVPSLFDRYQEALAHETRRSLRRDPSMLWIDPISADEDQHRRYRQRRAEKIFGKANNVLLNSLADRVFSSFGPLQAARRFLSKFDRHLNRTGPARSEATGATGPAIPSSAAALGTRFDVSVSTRPRVEMRSHLPGNIRARVQVPLLSPGIRTDFSRPLTSFMSGTVSAGLEDAGEDKWVAAGLSFRF